MVALVEQMLALHRRRQAARTMPLFYRNLEFDKLKNALISDQCLERESPHNALLRTVRKRW